LLIEKGQHIAIVAKWMGHSVQVCERNYVDILPEYNKGIEAI